MPSDQHTPSPDPYDGLPSSTHPFRHATDPSAFLSSLPQLAALPVEHAIVAVVMGQGQTLGVLHGELDHLDRVVTAARSGVTALKAVRELSGSAVLLAGFGPPERVDPHVRAFLVAAAAEGVPVLEALRATGDRYWSYLCRESECCPSQGRVFAGALPESSDPEVARNVRVTALLEPVAGVAREEVAEEAARVEERVRAASRGHRIPEMLEVLRREREERVTDPATLAKLGVDLLDLRVRDAAWARIDPESASLHVRLWSRVARHVPRRHRAAPAALVAVAAWQSMDETLARAAVEVALKARPGYGMAVLMERALSWGLPAERWSAHMAQYLETGEGGEEGGIAGPVPPPR